MAHWWHRNPLKSTTVVKFDLKMSRPHPNSVSICSQLRSERNALIEKLSDPSSLLDEVEKHLKNYLSLLVGMALGVEGTGPSKLRHLLKYKWTQSVMGSTPLIYRDAIFELISICQEYALWLTKHAAMIGAKDDPTEADAKKAYTCLRKAAGVWSKLESEYYHRLLEKPPDASDIDQRITKAYVQQSIAEAQEITIARAISQGHSPSLISSLAYETSQTFLSAASAIKAIDPSLTGKWVKYFVFKSVFYETYAYVYHGENLLQQEKCGDAIRALQEAEKTYQATLAVCKEYEKMKGPGKVAKPQDHLFFRKLAPLLKRVKDKCIRENGMIFHQKVSEELIPLQTKATHGLVTPEDFSLPSLNALWNKEAYDAFVLTDVTFGDKKQESKDTGKSDKKEELPPVAEKAYTETTKDPKNESGCLIQ